jgi:hypothetical protein
LSFIGASWFGAAQDHRVDAVASGEQYLHLVSRFDVERAADQISGDWQFAPTAIDQDGEHDAGRST